MKRGEIWWAELPRPGGPRPVLLLSRNEAYAVRALVTVAPLTTRIRAIPVEVELGEPDGLPKRCVVNLDSVATVAKRDLRRRMTTLSAPKVAQTNAALRFALGLDD